MDPAWDFRVENFGPDGTNQYDLDCWL